MKRIQPKSKNIPSKSNGWIFSLLSILLGVAAAATSIAYFVMRVYNERQHQEKWKDYNDCGLA